MSNRMRDLGRAHKFLASHAFYPLLLSSVLAFFLLVARIYRSRSGAYVGLPWNLFLAWVPYLGSLWAAHLHGRYPRRWWVLLIPGALWLAFFPNAPYLLTDFWHLYARRSAPLWYDIGLVSIFALTGLFLAVFSLRTMQKLVKDYVGSFLSWTFVLIVLGLSGLGMYLGRILRWNSWDLVLHPRSVLHDVVVRLANPLENLQAYGFSLLFAAVLLICYLALTSREQV